MHMITQGVFYKRKRISPINNNNHQELELELELELDELFSTSQKYKTKTKRSSQQSNVSKIFKSLSPQPNLSNNNTVTTLLPATNDLREVYMRASAWAQVSKNSLVLERAQAKLFEKLLSRNIPKFPNSAMRMLLIIF
mmetsp:Transcript_33196/g.42683  ORF Transcript_33196/g.42683 Transcript_33196/m.42683 type:complete len:138 (+) Transcript_33196:979-1392(+)